MFLNLLLDSLFLLEAQIILLCFGYLVCVFRFLDPLMFSVDIERRITIKWMKRKVNFYLMLIDLQNICVRCMMKVRMNFLLKVVSFMYLLLVIKGQDKGKKVSLIGWKWRNSIKITIICVHSRDVRSQVFLVPVPM